MNILTVSIKYACTEAPALESAILGSVPRALPSSGPLAERCEVSLDRGDEFTFDLGWRVQIFTPGHFVSARLRPDMRSPAEIAECVAEMVRFQAARMELEKREQAVWASPCPK
jgi:hypothetical protein